MTNSNAMGPMLLDSAAFLLFIHSWICITSLLRDSTVLLSRTACNLNRQDRQKIGKIRIIVPHRQTLWVPVRVNDLPSATQTVCGSANFPYFIQPFINFCDKQSAHFQVAFWPVFPTVILWFQIKPGVQASRNFKKSLALYIAVVILLDGFTIEQILL